jgi:hypothetical protein
LDASRLGRIGCSKTLLAPAKYGGLSHMLALDTHALSTFLIFSFSFKPVPRLTSFNFIPEALIILNQWNQICFPKPSINYGPNFFLDITTQSYPKQAMRFDHESNKYKKNKIKKKTWLTKKPQSIHYFTIVIHNARNSYGTRKIAK